MKLKLVICASALAVSSFAQAAYLDVITVKLKPPCSVGDFLKLNREMNDWGKAYEMTAEVAIPLFSDQPTQLGWVGRVANAATYGKAWDAWRNSRDKGDPAVLKMHNRWLECTEIISRRSYDTY